MSQVFRVERNRNFTVMANYHLKDKRLSLKVKGLLSVMLSLPDDWNYNMKGLARLSKDGIDSWPDPKKVIMLQELRDMYYRFMKLSFQARKEADAKLPLEIKADIWYGPYIQISGFEEKAS